MGISSQISAQEIFGSMIFAVFMLGTTSLAYDNPDGFISIDCGSDVKNSTDRQTNLLWVDDGDYIQSGKKGFVHYHQMSLLKPNVDNLEALRSFRYFPNSKEEKRSKYCYELPTRSRNVSYLVRAMFLHGNAVEIGLPSTFTYYINGSFLFTLTYTDEADTLDPTKVETIFFSPSKSDGSIINICLVPDIGVPFISSLELRELDPEGIMYTNSFGELMHEGVSFTNMLRWNTGAPNMSTVRYPQDPYDRFWVSPPGDWSFQNISAQQPWSQIGPEVNSVPSEVMMSAWASSFSDSLHVPLPYFGVGDFSYAIFYFALLNESTKESPLTVTVALDTIQYPSFNVTSQPTQKSLFHTLNARYVGIQFKDSFILNALEFYGQQRLVIPTTNEKDVHMVNHVKDIFKLTKWEGDPCTPVEYDWLVCFLSYYEANEYFVVGLKLSHVPNTNRLFELNSSNQVAYGLYGLFITSSHINSELFQFLLRDWVNATKLFTLNMSFNDIDTFPDAKWWTDVAVGSDYLLYKLDLSSNQLSEVPFFRDLPFSSTLQVLNLSHNLMTGDFPNELHFSNLTSLEVLNLSSNNFEGNIPWSLSCQNLPNLTVLDISNNQFSGEFPSNFDFDNNGSFQSLYADDNYITGVLNLTTWYNKLQTAISDSYVVHKTVEDGPANTFNQTFYFLNNKILSIEPSAEEFQLAIEKLIARDGFNQSGILLGGNPYCKNAKHFTQRYFCRSSTKDNVNPDVRKMNWTPIILGCVFGGSLLVVCFALFTWRIWKLSKKVDTLLVEKELAKRKVQPPYFFFNDLKSATQNFHSSKHLGRGHFGEVYKGDLSDGTTVAVKRLFDSERHQVLDEFLNEVVLINGIKHKNLIQLKGCCIENQERILVYGYAENGNIEDALWGKNSHLKLSWENRLKICVGIASGLTYLHEKLQPRIIHRDIKPANILLDNTFEPKIADFGLAKHCLENIDVHVTEVIAGTRGYFAPEYLFEGRVSTKIDVFSFGVLTLEIVSGRRCLDLRLPPEEIHLTSWAQKLQRAGLLLQLSDPALGKEFPEKQALKVMSIALMCVRRDPDLRPTMSEVETMLLEGKTNTYDKLNPTALQSEEGDLSEDPRYNSYGDGTVASMIAMHFSPLGSRMKDVEESPLLQGKGRSIDASEELPSFDTREEYSRALQSMRRSLSERITWGSARTM